MQKGLRMIRCTNPNGPEFVREVQQLGVDLIIVAVFARILKQSLINVPPRGCVNVHPSLLPRYRGPEPIYWVLANHEKMTGVTIHYIDEGIDSGDIVLQKQLEIRPDETELTLMQRSLEEADDLLREAIPLLIAGRAPRLPQDRSVATYYSFPPRRCTGLEFKLASFL
jgi:methionyl-tRNA formyltransferase